MKRSGFTLIEIVITIALVGILLVLSFVSLDATLISSRDEERKTDIETIASYLESYYTTGSQYDGTTGQYPSVATSNPLTDNILTTNTNELNLLRDVEPSVLVAPDAAATTLSSLIAATDADQNTTDVSPQPTTAQYIYQPIANDGSLCDQITETCRKFNLYYKTESGGTVKMVTSRHQ